MVTILRIGVALCLISGLMGCSSSISINHDFDRDADFASYKTFDWIEAPTAVMGSARAAQQRNSLLDKRVKTAVERELSAKGFQKESDNPDLLLVYHTGVQDKVEVTDWGYRYSYDYWGYGGRDISVYNYQQGTLIVDLIEAKTMELVWRGSATKALETNPTPEQVEKTLNEAIARMFQRYPPSR